MLVYRDAVESVDPRACLGAIAAKLTTLAQAPSMHEGIVDVLVEFGALHAAVLDMVFPERDDTTPLSEALGQAGCALAELLRLSWHSGEIAPAMIDTLLEVLARLDGCELPVRVERKVLEGYAYYGLYPETYLAAAERLRLERQPERVVCLGVRSIGASLAALVAATLQFRGSSVRYITLRPRGEPFDRRPAFAPTLEQELRDEAEALFAIVDEGPGLSGSSFCGTAEALIALGIAEERVVLFPSWEPDGSGLLSAAARRRWPRHAKYLRSFEDVWGARILRDDRFRDLSAGGWRALFFETQEEEPAVQPQHERRKYLCLADAARPLGVDVPDGTAQVLLKFAGLGETARHKLGRASQLAAAGFGPPALGVWNGFLLTAFVPGAPLAAGDADEALLGTMAEYLAYRARSWPGRRTVSLDALLAMMRRNVALGLGEDCVRLLAGFERFRSILAAAPVVEIDGRMLPHEWIRLEAGHLKTDGLDHHDDHFLPGDQDIAWDVAGAAVEFGLGPGRERALVRQVAAQTHDGTLNMRMPFYRVAYLAYRLGYATLAEAALRNDRDAPKWKSLSTQYADRLRAALEEASEAGP